MIGNTSHKFFDAFIDVGVNDIEAKFENMKIIWDQLRNALHDIEEPRGTSHDQMAKLSIIGDPGARDNVLGPRDFWIPFDGNP